MKKIELPNSEIIHIDYRGRTFYGASQQFYKGYIKKLSGCGPTTAANQLMYMSLTNSSLKKLYPHSSIDYERALEFMNTIWGFVTPGMRGVDRIDTLARGGETYGASVGVEIKADMLHVSPNVQVPSILEAGEWLGCNLEKGCPPAFLNLDSGKERRLYRWHWVLVTGIEYDEDSLYATLYDEGSRKRVDLGLWITTTALSGGFVSFSKA